MYTHGRNNRQTQKSPASFTITAHLSAQNFNLASIEGVLYVNIEDAPFGGFSPCYGLPHPSETSPCEATSETRLHHRESCSLGLRSLLPRRVGNSAREGCGAYMSILSRRLSNIECSLLAQYNAVIFHPSKYDGTECVAVARSSNGPAPDLKATIPSIIRDGMKVSVWDSGDSNDNIFGTTHNYGSSFFSGSGIVTKARPTMISAKYRLKEERRKVLKISINKLKKIEDLKSSLRRSVLIKNTMKRLQKEAKEEKLQKQQVHSYPRCHTPYKTPSGFSRHTPCEDGGVLSPLCGTNTSNFEASVLNDTNKEITSPFAQTLEKRNNKCLLEDEIIKSEVFLMPEDCLCPDSIDELVDATEVEARARLTSPPTCLETCPSSPPVTCSDSAFISSKKRPFDEVEDCDVHAVLSQFYMPPTPRMLTSIDDTDDEDEDVNVVDVNTSPIASVPVSDCKRPRLDSSGDRLEQENV
uniref:SERTA domain-containing protein n=1 Tax=Timema bartmani TaxID=61472 RepID=A0A7R9EXI3_9NEOP|nr:unnamed protein product [Timema bartmani]